MAVSERPHIHFPWSPQAVEDLPEKDRTYLLESLRKMREDMWRAEEKAAQSARNSRRR